MCGIEGYPHATLFGDVSAMTFAIAEGHHSIRNLPIEISTKCAVILLGFADLIYR